MSTAYAYYNTGETVVALIRSDNGQYADVVAEALENYDSGSITAYDIAATETGNTGEYSMVWPTWLAAGLYTIQWVPLAGATIAETDLPNRFAMDSYYWDETDIMPALAVQVAEVLTDTDTLLTRLTAARATNLDSINNSGKYKVADTTGNWGTAGTWSDDAVPVAGDHIIIRNGVTVTIADDINLGIFGTLEMQGSAVLGVANGVNVDLLPREWFITFCDGTIVDNYGTVDYVSYLVEANFGVINVIRSPGTVGDNYGTVQKQEGRLGYNLGHVQLNSGQIIANHSVVANNIGEVTTNNGVVANSGNGVVVTNYSTVYGGSVTNNSGTHAIYQTGDSFVRLGAPAGASVSADIAEVKTDTGNLVTRITATLFSGITSFAQWIGAVAGKQTANSTALTEIRATGAGSGTYDPTTDSQEAIRDTAPLGTAMRGTDNAHTASQQIADLATITAKTNLIPASPAAVGDAMTLTAAYDAAKTAAQAGEAATAAATLGSPLQTDDARLDYLDAPVSEAGGGATIDPQDVRDAMLLAPSSGVAASGSIDYKIDEIGSPQQVGTKYPVSLDSDDVTGNLPADVKAWDGGSLPVFSSATGNNIVTVVTRSTDLDIIVGVTVDVYASGTTTLVDRAITSTSTGYYVFMLNDGDYDFYAYKSGYATWDNPTTVTISGNQTVNLDGTVYIAPAPATGDLVRLYTYVADLGLEPNSDIEMIIGPSGTFATNGSYILSRSSRYTSDGAGYLYADIGPSIPIKLEIPMANLSVYTITPSSGVLDITTLW